MKRLVTAVFLFTAGFCLQGQAQIGVIADKAYVLDTLKTNSYSAGLSFLFYVSDNEMKEHTNYRFANSGHFTWLFEKTDIEASLRQIVERQSDGEWISNDFVLLSSGIHKYRPIGDGKTILRKTYAEPIFIYQDNSDRGLRRRFQAGALFHPWGLIRPKFNVNVGLGIVRDWSSWEVNDAEEIAAASPELREKIEFINSRVDLRKGMYQDHSEWRPMLLLTMHYRLNERVNFNINTSYQQSLKSPYSSEIKAVYHDLKRVYPYILTQFDIHVNLYKGLSMSLSTTIDYENSNLSLYKSSWAYSTLIGFSWTFSNQAVR